LFVVDDGFGKVILGKSGETDIDLLVIGTSLETGGVTVEGMTVLVLLLFDADDEL